MNAIRASFVQPPGFATLFGIELWERFSFYGLQALLVFYLERHLALGSTEALLIYTSYAAVAGLTLLVGGFVADNLLGLRRTVFFGAVMLAMGHGLMAVELPLATTIAPLETPAFFVIVCALSLIAVGVGFVKSSATALLGKLYGPQDSRRDTGFTLYFVAINLGGTIAPFVCGSLGELAGWRFGFGAAAVGMLVGLATFVRGFRALGNTAEPDRGETSYQRAPQRNAAVFSVITCATILVSFFLIRNGATLRWLVVAVGIAFVCYFANLIYHAESPLERRRFGAALSLLAFALIFWATYRLQGGVINLFTEFHVDRKVFGTVLPPSMFGSLDSIFVIFVFAPVITLVYSSLAARDRSLSGYMKVGFGIIVTAAAVLTLVIGLTFRGPVVPLVWLIAYYAFSGAGELLVTSNGVSLMTRLLPKASGFAVAAWYFASIVGVIIAGGAGADITRDGATVAGGGDRYRLLFLDFGIAGVVAGLVLIALAGAAKRATLLKTS